MNRRIFLIGAMSAPFMSSDALAEIMKKIPTPTSGSLRSFDASIRNLISRSLSGDLASLEANLEMFELIRENFNEMIFFSLSKSLDRHEDFVDLGFADLFDAIPSRELFSTVREFDHNISAYRELIGPFINSQLDPTDYIHQVTHLNTLIRENFGSRNVKSDLAAFHASFGTGSVITALEVIRLCKTYLGFDYADDRSAFDVSAYWPDSFSYPLFSGYADLYRGDNLFVERNIRIVSYSRELSNSDLALFYSWIYSPSFEAFLTISDVPDQLPPWIVETNPELQALHAEINQAVMNAFRAEQEAMES